MEGDIINELSQFIEKGLNAIADIEIGNNGLTCGVVFDGIIEFSQTSWPMALFYLGTSAITLMGTYESLLLYKETLKDEKLQEEMKNLTRFQRARCKFKAFWGQSKARRKLFSRIIADDVIEYIKKSNFGAVANEAVIGSANAVINENDAPKVEEKEESNGVSSATEQTVSNETLEKLKKLGLTKAEYEEIYNKVFCDVMKKWELKSKEDTNKKNEVKAVKDDEVEAESTRVA